MENIDLERRIRHRKSKILAGIIIIAFGTLFLIDRMGANIPNWIFSWKMIIIAVGIVTLYKHQFKHFFGYVLIGVGTVFLINDFRPDTIDSGLLLPVIVIIFGLTMLLKTTGLMQGRKKRERNFDTLDPGVDSDSSPSDYLESTALFGGVTKNVTSKNFQGADIVSVFGGTEINLTKADLQHPVTINTTTVFGGLKLIVPSDWQIQSELITIFGGLEDNRGIMNDTTRDDSKILILKGNCTFGGVEIKSYS